LNVCVLTSLGDLNAGGIANHAFRVAKSLSKRGHRFTIITRGSWRHHVKEEIDGIQVIRVRFLPLYPLHVSFHGRFVNSLLKALQEDFNIIHAHSPLIPVPAVELPIMTTVHTPMRSEAQHIHGFSPYPIAVQLQIRVVSRLEERLFQRSGRIGAVAGSVIAELASYGVSPDKVDWLGTGVDHESFIPSRNTSSPDPYVLYSGRLLERKGLPILLQAAAMVCKEERKVKFVLLGDGPMKHYLERESVKLGLQNRFVCLGHIPFWARRQELVEFYQHAAIYVQPSFYEGLPATLLEAMACGKAVVATAVSGHLDVINNRINGLLVPPNDPQALAESLLKLLQDSTLRHTLGQAARTTIEEKFTWDAVAQRTFRSYQKVA